MTREIVQSRSYTYRIIVDSYSRRGAERVLKDDKLPLGVNVPIPISTTCDTIRIKKNSAIPGIRGSGGNNFRVPSSLS